MKAVAISRPGGPEVLEIRERPLPSPGRGSIWNQRYFRYAASPMF